MATREQISVQAHNRRVNEACDRLRRQLDAARGKILRELDKLEAQLRDDPIRAGGIRYSVTEGFSSKPIAIEADALNLTFALTPQSASSDEHPFQPADYTSGTARVRPLGLYVSSLATFVPVAVENFELSYRIAINWVKERSPQESKTWLIDAESGEYYYPIDTNLRGDVVAGFPQVGAIAFEPFRRPTSKVILHFSGIKLLQKRGSTDSFEFHHSSVELVGHIASVLQKGTIKEQVLRELDRVVLERMQMIERERCSLLRPVPKSGCLLLLATVPVAVIVGIGVLRWAVHIA